MFNLRLLGARIFGWLLELRLPAFQFEREEEFALLGISAPDSLQRIVTFFDCGFNRIFVFVNCIDLIRLSRLWTSGPLKTERFDWSRWRVFTFLNASRLIHLFLSCKCGWAF